MKLVFQGYKVKSRHTLGLGATSLIQEEEVAMEKVKEYAFTTVLNTSYEDAISKITEALKEEGFGVLT